MDGWVSLSPGELRAKGLRQIQARLDTEGVWRVPEVQGAAGKSRSRKFHVLCMDNPWMCQHQFNTLPLHPGGSWFGGTSWEDWAHWSPRCSREAWP